MEEATRIKFEALEAENNRQNHRIEELEEDLADLRSLTSSVERLSINMQHMLDQMKTQDSRIGKLENTPLENLKSARQTLINTLVSVFAGALGLAILQTVVKYM